MSAPVKLTAARRAFDAMYDRILADYPDVYRVPGLGWCGPDWQIVEARTDALAELRWRGLEKRGGAK